MHLPSKSRNLGRIASLTVQYHRLFPRGYRNRERGGGGNLTLLAENLIIHNCTTSARAMNFVRGRALENVRVFELDVAHEHAPHLRLCHRPRALLARHFRGLLLRLDAKRGAAAL